MRYCVIKVGDFSYAAFSPSTCEAVADALKRFPHARSVSVRTRLHAPFAAALPAALGVPWPARQHASGELAWGEGLACCAPALH
ncbi:hypothetical protein D3C71_1816940 [compost metagenome]